MTTSYRFSLYDKRIDAECHEMLPNHPHVASYIAGSLRANDGSVLVARLLCDALNELENRAEEVPSKRADVFAQAQRQDDAVLGRLFEHLRQIDDKYITRSINFMWRLRDTMERENKIVPKDGSRPDLPRYRVALAIKKGEEGHTLFTIIFNTAYAMLSEVPIELVTEVAA